MTEPTRYEAFNASFQTALENDTTADWRKERATMYDLSKAAKSLQKFQNKASGPMFVYLFGDQLGSHLWEKFVGQARRNVLNFFTYLTDEYRIFILHEIQTNPTIWIYG